MATKILNVTGFEGNHDMVQVKHLKVYVTNDKKGKTISISNSEKMFTIPFEPLEK